MDNMVTLTYLAKMGDTTSQELTNLAKKICSFVAESDYNYSRVFARVSQYEGRSWKTI